MKLITAELISEYGGELRENYSGRGMYGKETCGVVFDSERDFFHTLADMVKDGMEDNSADIMELLPEALKNLQTDSMGKSIIYY